MITRGRHPVIVIGAGVSGLTTAVCLAEAGETVRVWAADLPQQTVSAVAGALWGPSFQEPLADTLAWTRQSLLEFRQLATDPGTGVRMAPALIVGNVSNDADMPAQVRMIPNLRAAGVGDIPEGFAGGFLATMPLIDMPRYLDHLTERLLRAGSEIEQHPIESLSEATNAAPIVVNCSGLGAAELASDSSLRPVFGQHVIMTNPGLDRVIMELGAGPQSAIVLPHSGRVVCGAVSIPGRADTTADPQMSDDIVRRCRNLEPRLRDAEVIETMTGLRPDRAVVRVGTGTVDGVRVIHNYGHGGNGISLSWGCARRATALVRAG